MIIVNDTNELKNSIETEKEFFNYNLKSQENFKSIILNYMQNFSNSTNNINLTCTNCITDFLDKTKDSLNLCNENISNLEKLSCELENLAKSSENNDENLKEKIDTFNSNYNASNKIVLQNTIKIEDCLNFISKESELKFSSTNNEKTENIQVQNIALDEKKEVSKIIYDPIKYSENTLIVSETSQNVTLPYKLSEINEIIKNEPNKYSSVDDVITKKYTLPLKTFKNPTVSRFKQGFKLMREKEHSSFRAAFDLGMELVFDSNLHPAIIPACSNLEELDKYLYYMEKEETDKFDKFNIVFECPPTVKK